MQNGNSRILFITDLIVMFIFFFLVFRYYTGGTMISLKGNILMGLIVIYWFLISVNSNVLRINRLSTTISVSKDILIAYSVLSTITIATVAIFGEFRPNDKLILYPLLFGAISSTVLRLFYLLISKQCLKHGYLQKSVLLVGSGHTARQIVSKVLSTPALGFRIKGVLSDNDLGLPVEGLYLGKLEQFADILQRDAIDEVIIAESSSETLAIRRIVVDAKKRGCGSALFPIFSTSSPNGQFPTVLGIFP